MANPTEAQVQTQLKNRVDILKELRAYIETNGENYVTHESTDIQAQFANRAPESLAALARFRASLSQAINQGSNLLTPIISEYARIKNLPGVSADSAMGTVLLRLYEHMHANGITVNSRGFSFGSPTASSANVGNGLIWRLNTDAYGYSIESQHADKKVIVCTKDEHSGASEHREVFEIRGGVQQNDSLVVSGSGGVGALTAVSAANSLLLNASFSSESANTSGADCTTITNWTAGSSVANFEIDKTHYYRDFPGDNTPCALRVTANDSIEQNLNVANQLNDPAKPYYLQVAYNRSALSGSGTNLKITLQLGSKSVTASGIQGGSGWNILKLAIDTNLWHRNWNQEDPKVKITIAGLLTGRVLIDDVILAPMTMFDNSWYIAVGGTTPFLRNDTFTATDTIATDAVIQYWLWRAYKFYWPSNASGGETITDP